MFTLQENPTFKHRVTAKVPIDGGYSNESFEVTYRVLAPERLNAFDLSSTEGSTDFLREVIVGLGDIAGPDKKAIPYSDALRDEVIDLPYARAAIAQGYFQAISGARSGN